MGNALQKLKQLHEDYTITMLALKASNREAKEIIETAKKRVESDMKTASVRAAVLSGQVADPTRSDTIRRLAAAELENLHSCTYSANASERALFAEKLEEIRTARTDAIQIERDFETALKAANEEISKMRKDVMGDTLLGLVPNWIEGLEKEFGWVCRERGANE